MVNYFTSFRLLTLLGVNNNPATRVFDENSYANVLSWEIHSCNKRNLATLNSAHQAKKQCNFDSSWLDDSKVVYVASSESFEPKGFVRCWNNVERKHIQEHLPNQFHCYNQNMGFVNRMDQNVAKHWCSNEKMVVAPVCLNDRCMEL